MRHNFSASRVRGILLDIEGTTTPIQFVYTGLFPFARAHLKNFLQQNFASQEMVNDIAALFEEHTKDTAQGLNPPAWDAAPVESKIQSIEHYLQWLMDRDRKSTGLKSVQGRIWQQGYRGGDLKGQVFADVPAALKSWTASGIDVRIFSSGSVLAQKLLFANTEFGDLSQFLNGYFDTTMGSKTASESYRRIAAEFRFSESEVLFVSDVAAELDAAQISGMQTLLCVRPGNPPQANVQGHAIIDRLSDIAFSLGK